MTQIIADITRCALIGLYIAALSYGILSMFTWLLDKLIIKLCLTNDLLRIAGRYYKEKLKKRGQ